MQIDHQQFCQSFCCIMLVTADLASNFWLRAEIRDGLQSSVQFTSPHPQNLLKDSALTGAESGDIS